MKIPHPWAPHTSQAAWATSSKGSQITTFPGASMARTAATADTPRFLTSSPSWRSFNTSSAQKAASLIHVFVVSCCIVGRFPVVCNSPCPPRTRTSLQPFAAAEVSTAMALKREDRLPGPGDATPEDQASKMCCSYLQLL